MKLKLCDGASQDSDLEELPFSAVICKGAAIPQRLLMLTARLETWHAHAFDIELGQEDASNNIKKCHMPGTCSWTITFPILSPTSHGRFKLAKTSN